MDPIKAQLESKFDREKVAGLCTLLAWMSDGHTAREYFADVVKLCARTSGFRVRKLVYVYLLHYAEQEPELALLSINSFQKDLSDKNMLIRAMALRVLSSIKVPSVCDVIMMSVSTCVRDLSPYVRKAAAYAISKCYMLDQSLCPELIELIKILLEDTSTIVIAGAVSALYVPIKRPHLTRTSNQVCPDFFDVIHPQFRRMCKMLLDADEWSQIEILRLLLRYSRVCIQKPVDSEPPSPDLELFLDSCERLLYSRNNAVVMGVAQVLFYLCPVRLQSCAHALVRSYHPSCQEERFYILKAIRSIASVNPLLFSHDLGAFLIFDGEHLDISKLKLEILYILVNSENARSVFAEFKFCVTPAAAAGNMERTVFAIRVLTRVCARVPSLCDESSKLLIKVLAWRRAPSPEMDKLLGECVEAISRIIQLLPSSSLDLSVLALLVGSVERINKDSPALACVMHIIASLAGDVAKPVALDTLRLGVKGFASGNEEVKLAVLALGSRVFLCFRDPVGVEQDFSEKSLLARNMFYGALDLADMDESYIVRDRARFFRALFELSSSENGIAEKVLFSRRISPNSGFRGIDGISYSISYFLKDDPSGKFIIGTMSHALGKEVPGYTQLPAWSEYVDPDFAVQRDVSHASAVYSGRSGLAEEVNTQNVPIVNIQASSKRTSMVDGKNSSQVVDHAGADKKRHISLDDFLASSDED